MGRFKRDDAGTGMLFSWTSAEPRIFWMRDTWIPLTLGFFDEDGLLFSIQNMQPESDDYHFSIQPALNALELSLGQFEIHDLREGVRMSARICSPLGAESGLPNPKGQGHMKVARVYLRVSTASQDLARQDRVVTDAKAAGFYVAGIYREKASGARTDRPELLRMDLQPGEVVIAERVDRLSRLPLPEAERLVATIRAKGAKLAVPGVVDLTELASESKGVAKVVLESVQDMLLKLALQMARDDYEERRERQSQGIELAKQAGKYNGRKADAITHERIITLRRSGHSIAETARLAGCSPSQVKRIWAQWRAASLSQSSHL